MNKQIICASVLALTAGLTGAAFAQGAGKVSMQDLHFTVPAAPAANLRLYTSVQYPYSLMQAGGVRVAVGDVNGDGRPDLVAVDPAGSSSATPHVKVFSGANGAELTQVSAASLGAGAADVNGDGAVDIIINSGGPESAGIIINRTAGGIIINRDAAVAGHVKVFDGKTGGLIAVTPQGAARRPDRTPYDLATGKGG